MNSGRRGLTVIESHPVQYHAPVYRYLQQNLGIPVTVIYGSDSSIRGAVDPEFGTKVAWDTDLLSGYRSVFLSRGGDEPVSSGLREALRSALPGPVLVLGYGTKFERRALLATILSGRPVLLRAETTDHARTRSPLRRIMRDILLTYVYRRCSSLLYIGHQSLRHYQRLGCSASILLSSPYCVDTTPFQCTESARIKVRDATRAEVGASQSDIVVLFSGKLSYRKGPDLLLEAVSRLDSACASCLILMFLGSGKMCETLKLTAETIGLRKPVFLGFQNQRNLSSYYHAADFLVLPSRHSETWGLVVNEAMHHGLPCVVSTAVGCAADLIRPGRTGEMFEADSSVALGDALLRITPLVGLAEVRKECRESVSGHTVEAAAKGIATAFERMLCRNAVDSAA